MGRAFRLLLPLTVALHGGCAAVTNNVADAIPVNRLPVEVLARPKTDLKPIPLTLLRQRELEPYTLDRGDVLAVVADELIAPAGAQVPVRLPDQNNSQAAVGFPIPVNDDGTISIPRLKPILVRGLTLAQVEKAIRDAAGGRTGGLVLLNPEVARINVQLMQKRTYTVTVVREDLQPLTGQLVGGAIAGTSRRGNGFTLRLQAGENDVLRALNATGGPPGLEAKDEIIIERGTYDPANPEKSITRIPLRIFPEQSLNICEADIVLRDGDVVKIESRESSAEIFYVAGLAGSRQFQLPRDYDLDVVQALTLVGAPLENGGFSATQFNGQSVAVGIGSPSPRLLTVLRQLPDGRQIPIRVDLGRAFRDPRERIRVLGGDILVLQERPGDATLRYLYQTFRFNLTATPLGSFGTNPTVNATGQAQVP